MNTIRALAITAATALLLPICEALAAVAAQSPGFVFGDLRFSRVQVTPTGEGRLLEVARGCLDRGGQARANVVGMVRVVLPQFLSPEAARGLRLDARADVFAVGAVLYTLVSGASPLPAEDSFAQLQRLGAGARYVTSVCTGSLALAAAGLLKGRRAACHWAWRDLLSSFDGVTPDAGRVVRDGPVITGGGVTAGIDMAITLMAEIQGEAFAQAVQLGIEYAPAPPFDCGRPERAAPAVLQAVQQRLESIRPDRLAVARQAAQALRAA